jgi:small basic protein (TIGR04137 family)
MGRKNRWHIGRCPVWPQAIPRPPDLATSLRLPTNPPPLNSAIPRQFPSTAIFIAAGRCFDILITRFNQRLKEIMSQHRSLRAASTLGGKRNVLKRFERTELLKKRGQWKPGDRITGLRKTKPEA